MNCFRNILESCILVGVETMAFMYFMRTNKLSLNHNKTISSACNCVLILQPCLPDVLMC